MKRIIYRPMLFWFCIFALIWVSCLLFVGGFTTTIRAGMAFLDWPLSNGSLNPEGWTTQSDQLAEHSHRLLGMKVGLLSLIACVWVHLTQSRTYVRLIARLLVWMVILQGLLGGARVIFDQLNVMVNSNALAQTFAVLHALGAQITVGLWVALTLTLSRNWIETPAPSYSPGFRRWSLIATGALAAQLLIGAVMRHSDAGLAIPTFPLAAEGSLIPSVWSFPVAIHFAHRVGALVVTAVLIVFCARALCEPALQRVTKYLLVGGLVFLINMQIFLGALIIWTYKNAYVATLHVFIGIFMLATLWAISFLSMRRLLKKS